MTDVDRLELLERRLRALEDEAAITRLIASYGPLVDSGSAEAVAELWEAGGDYDVDTGGMHGHAQLSGMVRSGAHQRLITGGCAHFIGLPHVVVDGDHAVVTCHSQLITKDGAVFRVRRITANRWELRRGPEGWRVVRRTSRLLDGRAEARQLLADAGVLNR